MRYTARLRWHFERFNVDVSDPCQWLVKLRPKQVADDPGVPLFWNHFLPTDDAIETDASDPDGRRLALFETNAGIRPTSDLSGMPLAEDLRKAIRQVAERLFERLRMLEPAHRFVLVKAAAEWILARYQHGVENWERQHLAWQEEKREWETRHPVLTESIRDGFTHIFKELERQLLADHRLGV